MPPKGRSSSFFLEGPETYSAGWGVLSCSGFTMEPPGEDDYNEVILRCADKATMKLHNTKDAQVTFKSVHRGNQFFLQWDSEALCPTGRYEFVWERNGEPKATSNVFDFKEVAPAEQQELRNPMAEENMSYNEVRETLRPHRENKVKRLATSLFAATRFIISTLISLTLRLPFILFRMSKSSFRISRWSFRQWTQERQMACAGCGVLCRPFGIISGSKCTRSTSGIWIRGILCAAVCFWFVNSSMRVPPPPKIPLPEHPLKSGSLSSLKDLSEVAYSKVAVVVSSLTGTQNGGKAVPSGVVWGQVGQAAVAVLQPAHWVFWSLLQLCYWAFGLVFPAFFSWILLDLTVPSLKCCKCAALPAGMDGAKPVQSAAADSKHKPCSACSKRR
mmetsp:Transcript_12254/g.24200  ORF Transcript_12254/g.24200 Transcript_12254/m.24200 type:complete len:388 (+) Transcript_12254:129-1292(+)